MNFAQGHDIFIEGYRQKEENAIPRKMLRTALRVPGGRRWLSQLPITAVRGLVTAGGTKLQKAHPLYKSTEGSCWFVNPDVLSKELVEQLAPETEKEPEGAIVSVTSTQDMQAVGPAPDILADYHEVGEMKQIHPTAMTYFIGSVAASELETAFHVARNIMKPPLNVGKVVLKVDGKLNPQDTKKAPVLGFVEILGSLDVAPIANPLRRWQSISICAEMITDETPERIEQLAKHVTQLSPLYLLCTSAGIPMNSEWKVASKQSHALECHH
eukprot:g33881.t1